jgi:hypothetical protein
VSPSRSLTVAAVLALAVLSGALVPAPVLAQGARSVEEEPKAIDPSGLRQEQKADFERAMREIREGQIQAEADRTVGLRNCKKDKACERQVMDAYHDRQRELANQKTQKTAQYKIVLGEIAELERRWKEYQRTRQAPRR